MPVQFGKCEGCGFEDYLEYVHAKPHGAWLCKYCRETLYEDGEIELENGEKIEKEYMITFIADLDEKEKIKIMELIESNMEYIKKVQEQLESIDIPKALIYADVVVAGKNTPIGDVELVLRIDEVGVRVVERLIKSPEEGEVEEVLLASVDL